ncbi:DUF4760 domain-containing protein [Novosphingobium mathurense]|uniref:DUF4760 domain-containing protein n=1 Tax=Novosphingobium mathurense TaxID=428990 RepID=A0A1U6GTJ1_9SPHN|nr:DUF4760 domain-containing protein [Novosphingobium mathurense]SLJ86873.1 protein of unknown function [Novosphingobium mathurense]
MELQKVAQIAQIVSTTAILISAATAITVLIYTRRTNRRRATLDMVMKTFVDDGGRILYDKFISLTRRDSDKADTFTFVDLKDHTPANEDDRNVVIDQMNTYELVALGIRNGVFDDKFFKHWYHSQFMRDYKALEPLMLSIREDRPSTFCEFRWLYEKWQKNQHPENEPGRLRKVWWALTGKDEKLKAVLSKK